MTSTGDRLRKKAREAQKRQETEACQHQEEHRRSEEKRINALVERLVQPMYERCLDFADSEANAGKMTFSFPIGDENERTFTSDSSDEYHASCRAAHRVVRRLETDDGLRARVKTSKSEPAVCEPGPTYHYVSIEIEL